MNILDKLFEIASDIFDVDKQNEAAWLEKGDEWIEEHGKPVVNTKTGKVEKKEE